MKYSILIPAYNGADYISSCIESIITQDYADYELIISDDHSTDNTSAVIKSYKNDKITILSPENKMSMAEHWEWLLSHAKGDWIIFVGQDDGLQPYFFTLADTLTKSAEKKRINAIMSRRAYFFWPGCEKTYGDIAVKFSGTHSIKTKRFKIELFRTLTGMQTYFDLPEMYTTSLFSRRLLLKAKTLQQGAVFTTHPQDANLAAIACSIEQKFLYSDMPLGWVGSSPKSAGLAVVANYDKLPEHRKDYLDKIKNSNLRYSDKNGSFEFASLVLYFWNAIESTSRLRSFFFNFILQRKFTRRMVYSAAMEEVKKRGSGCYGKDDDFSEILRLNLFTLQEIEKIRNLSYLKKITATECVSNKVAKILNNIKGFLQKTSPERISITIKQSDNQNLTLIKASEIVKQALDQVNLV